MSDVEVVIRLGVLALIAVSGLVRVIAALFVPGGRRSVTHHRVAHACWFTARAAAFLLRLFFPPRELIHLSTAANTSFEATPGSALSLFLAPWPGAPQLCR